MTIFKEKSHADIVLSLAKLQMIVPIINKKKSLKEILNKIEPKIEPCGKP